MVIIIIGIFREINVQGDNSGGISRNECTGGIILGIFREINVQWDSYGQISGNKCTGNSHRILEERHPLHVFY